MGAGLLVIRRRAGEAIVLGAGIEIEVIEISRTRVKLGVKAPKEVVVSRREVLAVASENRGASDLLASRGAEALERLALLFRNLPHEMDKVPAQSADM